ncbi:MAG: restriction endonuclease subunit S, partial [Nitrospira sp.]|nr:restriction endonuclease subunit S [Nitrospira sp.]
MGVDRPLDITANQRKTLLALLKRHLPNTTAWAYGSRVKWTARPQSDLDLVVFTAPDQDRRVSELREAFEESNLPFRVDLFVWDVVPEQFRKQIETEHVVLVEREEQSTESDWIRRKIGALGRVVTGKTPSTVEKSNFDGPYPFITIPDLDGRVFIDNTERTLSDKGAAVLRTCLLPPGAVLMSCIATVGRCGVTTRPSFTNQQINSVIPVSGVDSRFLYYVFTQLGHELESTGGGGSVYTNVSKNRFSNIEVLMPVDLAEQRTIAHILGTLDDKIELNRRMNETLEAMARALFKSWFVDFDPVRA